jgi:hypothetical protein
VTRSSLARKEGERAMSRGLELSVGHRGRLSRDVDSKYEVRSFRIEEILGERAVAVRAKI